MHRQQSGMALLMVLMIFALVSVVATGIIEAQSTDIQRTTNRLGTQQAHAFVGGAESVVRSAMYLDWDKNPDVDHYLEEWAIDRTFPMEMGTVFVRISDAQGRFNLNWLHPSAKNRQVWQQRFTELLRKLQIDTQIASYLSSWLNKDSQEDNRYLAMVPEYRAAYRQCKHSSELMLIEGVTLDIYRLLSPYITCLPIDSQLNVNTASELVLASLDSRMSTADAWEIVSGRGDEGLESVSDFLALDVVKPYVKVESDDADSDGSSLKPWDAGDFNVRSEYFEAFVRVDMGDAGDWTATSEFLIKRDVSNGYIDTLYRDFSRREARPLPQTPSTNSGSGAQW